MAEKEKEEERRILAGRQGVRLWSGGARLSQICVKDTSQYGASLHTDNNGGHAWRADSASLLFPQTSTVRSPADLHVET